MPRINLIAEITIPEGEEVLESIGNLPLPKESTSKTTAFLGKLEVHKVKRDLHESHYLKTEEKLRTSYTKKTIVRMNLLGNLHMSPPPNMKYRSRHSSSS